MRRATINRADPEAIQIKGPQNADNKGSGCKGYTDQRARGGMRRATIKRAYAEAY